MEELTPLACDLCGQGESDCHCGDWAPWRCERGNQANQSLKCDDDEAQDEDER